MSRIADPAPLRMAAQMQVFANISRNSSIEREK
jgi:hypothetical protein